MQNKPVFHKKLSAFGKDNIMIYIHTGKENVRLEKILDPTGSGSKSHNQIYVFLFL